MTDDPLTIIHGDALSSLRILEDESAQCCVCSPPYWGLRDYGVASIVWDETVKCDHEFGSLLPPRPGRGNKPGDYSTSSLTNPQRQDVIDRADNSGAFCFCGAWRGCLGLEPTPELYVKHVVEIFHELKRVLRADGTLWLNLGDCYATGAGRAFSPGGGKQGESFRAMGAQVPDTKNPNSGIPIYQPNRMPLEGFKPKDLIGIPWMVAFALRADGWYLRSDIIWAKPNPMPESVTDRPTKSHEYIFLLSKSERYYYNAKAIAEPLEAEYVEMIKKRCQTTIGLPLAI